MIRYRAVIDNKIIEEVTLHELINWALTPEMELQFVQKLILNYLKQGKEAKGFKFDACTNKKIKDQFLYENDIVEFKLIQEVGEALLRGIITYSIDEMAFYIELPEEGFSINYLTNMENIVYMKIIGNYHQNEELLDFETVLSNDR